MTLKDKKSFSSDFASDFQAESRKEFEAAISRMLQAINGSSHDNLASFLEISKDAIYKAGRSNKIPPAWFLYVGKKTNFSLDWLVTGEGPMLRGNAQIAPAEAQNACPIPKGELQWMDPEAAPSMGYSLVPKVMARLCAGTGSLETDAKIVGYYAFKLDFLKRKGHPKDMVLMDISGDSMEPVLLDRDTVLIDQSQNAVIGGGLFAVGIDQEVYVKYLDKIPGKLILRSKNERYDPIEVDMNGQLSDAVRVIGRVVWSCREYTR